MPNITISDNALSTLPSPHASQENETRVPLMVHFASARASTTELTRSDRPWLPQRVLTWLAKRYAPRERPAQPDVAETNRTIALADEEEQFLRGQRQDEMRPSSSLRGDLLFTALAVLGATTIGTLAWYRFASRGQQTALNVNGSLADLNNGSLFISAAPDDAPRIAFLAAPQEATTHKQCLHHSLNFPGMYSLGLCPEEEKAMEEKQEKEREEKAKHEAAKKAEEEKRAEEARQKTTTTTKKPKTKCWYPNRNGPRGGGDKPGLCPENRPKLRYNKNRKPKATPKPRTTTTTETPPAEKIKYYIKRTQPELCKKFEVLARCENVHPNYPRKDRLILKYNDIDCYCPPPENKRSWYEIIYIEDEKKPTTTPAPTTTQSAKIKYYQKKTQPSVCQEILERCEKMHNAHEQVNSLLLSVGSNTCYCPPPQARKENYEVIFLEDETASTTTPKATTSTFKPVMTTTQLAKKKFYTKKTQPDICNTVRAHARCESVLVNYPDAKEMVLKYNDKNCYCSPPEKKRNQYEIIYLDVPVNNSSQPVTEPEEKISVSLSVTLPPPVKRGGKQVYLRLPEAEFDQLGRKLTPPVPESEPADDVRIEKMFDLDCIEARNSLSLSNIARIIGETLENPVTKLSDESAIIHSHNAGKGCPEPEELENMRAITSRIDGVLSLILQALPYSQPLRIAQNLIGPALQFFADHLDGIQTEISRINNFAMQLTQTARDLAPTLTTEQKLSLYNKPGQKNGGVAPDKSTFLKRFIFRAGKTYISVGGKEYQLRTQADEKPYIIDDKGRFSYVQYNKDVDQWGFIEEENNIFYSDKNQAYAEVYGISLADQPEGYTATVDPYHDFVTLTAPNKAEVTGVFVGNEFVPATLEKSGDEYFAFTTTPRLGEMKSLMKTPAGWVFDAPSTKMDEYLRLLLESKPGGIKLTPENRIGPINYLTRFSYNARTGNYIKHKERFYKTQLHSLPDDAGLYYELEGFSQAKLKFKDDTFVLKSETDMLFPLRTAVITELFPHDKVYHIENGALTFLLNHASTIETTAKSRLGPGLYSDKYGNYFFAAQNAKFAVNSFSDREVTIKGDPEMGYKKDIRLWSDGDTWYRIREETETKPIDYSDIALCRAKKSPGGSGGCLPVMVESNLHKQLQKHIIKGTSSKATPRVQNLVEDTVFHIPFLYKDSASKNYYFLYDEHYFDAKILEPEDKYNPTGLYGLTLTGKNTFFSRDNIIAHIITEKKNDKLEIKTLAAFAAEKLNTPKNIAVNYINKRLWRDISEMHIIEESVNRVQQSGDLHVEMQVDHFGSPKRRIEFNKAWDEASIKLYPQRILEDKGYAFRVFQLSSDGQSYGTYEQNAIQLCNDQIHYMQDKVIPTVMSALHYEAPDSVYCEDYIAEVLQSRDHRFNNDIMLALYNRLEKIDERITFLKETDKIFLATTHHTKSKISDPERTSSLLLPEEKNSGAVAIVPKDSDNYLFINIDKTDSVDYMSTLIYGAAQAYEMTKPLTHIEREQGIYIPIKDAVKNLVDLLEQQGLTSEQFENLKSVSKTYLENMPSYQETHLDDLLEQRKLAYLLKNDPGYKAHVLLNSSEFLTLITEDLYYRVSIKNAEGMPSRIDSWMKKYGEQRAFTYVKEKQPVRTDLTTEEVAESIINTTDFDGTRYLAEAQSIAEIMSGMENPVRNSDAISHPVANFMVKKGFTDIRHRAMALFISSDDGTPATHFAVVGKLGAKEYIFDLAAGEFSERYADLDGPLILPERKWAQKYALLSDNLLIKYADFDSLEDAQQRFSQFNQYLYWGPEVKIPGARVLRRPAWYFPDAKQPLLPALAGRRYGGRLGYTNPVREAARLSQLSAYTSNFSWNYAVKILENANLLTQGAAAELRAEILRAADFQRGKSKPPGALDDLFVNPRTVINKQQILQVKAGELLVFMATEPGLSAKGAHPVHMMVSTGNGRFAGIQNSFIDASLDDGKMILTAEQLGEFENGSFRRRGGSSLPEITLVAGYPKELKIDEYPDLRKLAERTAVQKFGGKFIADETTELLRVSGELSAEQTLALKEVLTPLLQATAEAGKNDLSIQDLLYHPSRVYNTADLATLPQGQLVIFGKLTSSYAASHVMYSMGYGEFLMADPTHLHAHLNSPNARIETWQFTENIIKEHKVYAGEVSLDKLRVTSLLGPDAKFVVKNNIVKVTAHGAILNAAFLDAPELADVIRGLGLRETPPVDWAKIEQVELNSCYSALGRLPLGKVMAYLLQKKVTAWPRLYSERVRNNPNVASHAKIYLPEQATPEELQLLKKQATRNYYFWSHMLRSWFYRTIDRLRKKRDADEWDNMFKNVFAVANGNITIDKFYEAMPEYKSQLNITPELFAAVIADPVEDAVDFAERCIDIFYLSRYTEKLLDEYLSQLD